MNAIPSVLVTDDDEDLRLLCRLHLERGGFQVTQAAPGVAALDVARRERPDLILLDLMMPVMDGWECLEVLKSDSDLRHIPVFVITGKTQREDQDRAFASGAEAFISKPYLGPDLVSSVRERLALAV